jgi:hypothetical protein
MHSWVTVLSRADAGTGRHPDYAVSAAAPTIGCTTAVLARVFIVGVVSGASRTPGSSISQQQRAAAAATAAAAAATAEAAKAQVSPLSWRRSGR